MLYKNVYTQKELEKAIEESFYPICQGAGEFRAYGQAQVTATGQAQVRATGQAQVRAYDHAQVTATGQAQVRAYDHAQVTATGQAQVTATGQAQVRATGQAQVTATGQAQVRATGQAQVRAYDHAQVTATGQAQVRAYDHAQVTATGQAQVRAYGQAQVRAYGQAQVRATQYVAVTIASDFDGKVEGGVQIKVPPVKTAEEWCEFYGVEVERGVATLYKAVDEDYSTNSARAKNISYASGNKPEAPDWDGGEAECGGGLHFSPTPVHALKFNPDAKHFVACSVRLEDIAVHYPAEYPEKVKAPRLCAPCYEVDINGNRIGNEP